MNPLLTLLSILPALFFLYPLDSTAGNTTPHVSLVHYLNEQNLGSFRTRYNSRYLILVSKGRRRLYLFKGKSLLKTYKIALGKRPCGDKTCQGDRRTPTGEFYICTKNPKSRFYLSLGISYPTIEDAKRGLKKGLISKKEYYEIVQAIKARRKPPWNTALGGAICIHGGGTWRDWTDGCIALNNQDIRDLFRMVPIGTPVIIVEQ